MASCKRSGGAFEPLKGRSPGWRGRVCFNALARNQGPWAAAPSAGPTQGLANVSGWRIARMYSGLER